MPFIHRISLIFSLLHSLYAQSIYPTYFYAIFFYLPFLEHSHSILLYAFCMIFFLVLYGPLFLYIHPLMIVVFFLLYTCLFSCLLCPLFFYIYTLLYYLAFFYSILFVLIFLCYIMPHFLIYPFSCDILFFYLYFHIMIFSLTYYNLSFSLYAIFYESIFTFSSTTIYFL